ncbi:hypothetical protein Tco_0829261 [Tanacetum coccineum]
MIEMVGTSILGVRMFGRHFRRWPSLYATEPRRDVDKKTYLIFGFTWAFKTWILESFRVGENDYYRRHKRYPRIIAWSSKKKFYRPMVIDFFHGRLPGERLTPDETEARSDWWVSSRSYFDGRTSQAERIPRHLIEILRNKKGRDQQIKNRSLSVNIMG